MSTPWKSVLGLALLAPLVGEFLLGNVTIREIGALVLLAPLYGGGALLVREAARRTGKGWPTVLALGAAYGLLEAGVFDGSLFSVSYEGVDYDAVRIPMLGVSAFYGLQFVINHAVWSIGIPILLAEALTPRRRTAPWLGRIALAVTAAVYLTAGLLIRYDSAQSGEYHVTWAQGLGVVAVVLALIALAFALPGPSPHGLELPWQPPRSLELPEQPPREPALPERPPHEPALPEQPPHESSSPGLPPRAPRTPAASPSELSLTDALPRMLETAQPEAEPHGTALPKVTARESARWVPGPGLVGVAAFVLSSGYMVLPATWRGALLTVKIVALAGWLVSRFSRREGWQSRHRVALGAGALLTYAWAGFLVTGLKHDDDVVAFVGNALFAVGALLLVAAAFRGRRTVTGATQEAESSRKA